jgi:pimeloyl-ACP methyl ester carboxylesterase
MGFRLPARTAAVKLRRMPSFERDGASIHYEIFGDGFPVLVFAPGGMRSAIAVWEGSPWDPTRELASRLRVVAMDQRNAGRSKAPVRAGDGWQSYTDDHVALLDHLGIERCHVMGGCIGSSYCLGLMQAAPERVTAAVLQNPIGLADNRDAFYAMFDGWAEQVREEQPEVADDVWRAFRERMYGSDFVFNVRRDFVRSCDTPLLILAGDDLYHPAPISREIADLAPNAELIERWREPEVVAEVVERVRHFLAAHTPA